jgi:serine/threonine-protein kinase
MLLEVGQTYAARYRVTRKLGEGAMGAVYEAEHVLIHRRVALKVLHAHVIDRPDARSILARFEREAQAAGRIGSPHIVEVLDLGELADGSRFMVMELLDGETLAQRVRWRGRLAAEEAVPIACQVLAGLGAAHAADIIHRDLKPANVFLVSTRGGDFVKVLDFGVSKFNAMGEDMATTTPGTAVGTPYYMSPEQAKGSRQVDHRSDLYAVGVLLYECVSGQVPFDGGTFNELIFRIVLESPPPLESFVPELDPAFVAIIRKAMAREAEGRYQSARELYDALAGWLAQATGGAVDLGAVPWDAAPERAPSSTSSPRGVPPGEVSFEHAATLLREPPTGRPLVRVVALGVISVLAIGSVMLFVARTGSDHGKAGTAGPALTPTLATPSASEAPPPLPTAAPSGEPSTTASTTSTAAPVVPTATAAARPGSVPPPGPPRKLAPGPKRPPPVPIGRKVPSEL